ncbi:MAG: phosphatase PAP2 family protein [Gammaproteobacteria bacterium]
MQEATTEASTVQVILRAGVPAFVTWLLLSLSFLVPLLDSTKPPYFSLDQVFPEMAYWLSQSGGKFGATIIGLLLLVLLVTRYGINNNRRWKEAGVVLLIATIFAGGGAAFNEHIIKTKLKIPRPNIIWLAGENGSGPLGMTTEQFYNRGNKEVRSQLLRETLRQQPAPVALSGSIEAHWIDETGYSFPSGHAYSAMFFAAFFLAIAASYLSTKRIWLFYALLPWALAVCYSRTILRLHTPADITLGGLQGLVLGMIAWAIARTLIRKFTQE